jgi:CubicO group peptidase (beta-lactamase class C family)
MAPSHGDHATRTRKVTMARFAALTLALLLPTSPAAAIQATRSARQTAPAWQADVDRVFATWDRRDSPGCAMAVYKDGAILYERGYGMADLEHDVPITPATVFYAGSVSKQFTAFAAALAIQQGLFALDDPIRRHLPELPAYADAITVRHLIHHTSGLRDFYTLLSIAGRRQDALFDNASILRMAAKQTALNFPPGADYLYSNTGYALLAIIIARASRTTFGAFTATEIFTPLGMSASHFGDEASRLVRDRAYGYAWGPDGQLRLDTPGGARVGAGGLFTTVRDLLRWDQNFYTGSVGGQALVAQMQSPGALNGGKPLTYAWGLQVGKYRGLRVIEHSGSLGGYRAHLSRYPDAHVSVAVLCNLSSITPATLVHRIADFVISDRFTEPAPVPERSAEAGPGGVAPTPARPATGPSPIAESAAGTYRSEEIDATFIVTVREGSMMLQRDEDIEAQPLQPSSDGTFRFRNLIIRFARSKDGKIEGMLVDAGRVRDIRFQRAR